MLQLVVNGREQCCAAPCEQIVKNVVLCAPCEQYCEQYCAAPCEYCQRFCAAPCEQYCQKLCTAPCQ